MEKWSTGILVLKDSVKKTSYPLLSPFFHYSIIPPFQFGIHKTMSTKNMKSACSTISEMHH
jgi:hypothetical protein